MSFLPLAKFLKKRHNVGLKNGADPDLTAQLGVIRQQMDPTIQSSPLTPALSCAATWKTHHAFGLNPISK